MNEREQSKRDENFAEETRDADVVAIHEPIAREKAEPRDGYEPISNWLVILALALAGWCGWYVGTFNGGWSSMVYDEQPAARGAAATAGETQPPDPMVVGRRLYVRCQACHQTNGRGIAGTYPPLDGSEWANGPAEIPIRVVLNGLQGPIEVHGEIYNNVMPGWRDMLTDAEIAAVLTYVRQSWGNAAGPVAPEEVERVRSETVDQGGAWTAADLEALLQELSGGA